MAVVVEEEGETEAAEVEEEVEIMVVKSLYGLGRRREVLVLVWVFLPLVIWIIRLGGDIESDGLLERGVTGMGLGIRYKDHPRVFIVPESFIVPSLLSFS